MPLYSYSCEDCGEARDEFRKLDDRNNCPDCTLCQKPMTRVITGYSVIGDLEPYYDENLGASVSSKQHRKKLMREQGVEEKFGINWHTAASSKRARTKGRI